MPPIQRIQSAVAMHRIAHDVPFRPNGTKMKPSVFHDTLGNFPTWKPPKGYKAGALRPQSAANYSSA